MDEELLAQEVLYLHSLWYVGPPNPNSNPNPYPNFAHNSTPYPNFAPSSTPHQNLHLDSTSSCNLSYPNPNPRPQFNPSSSSNCHLSYPNPNPRPHFNPISTSNGHLSCPNPNPRPHFNSISSSNRHLSHPNPNPRPHHNPTSNNSSNLHNRQPKKQRTDPSEEKEWPCDPTSLPDQSAPATWPCDPISIPDQSEPATWPALVPPKSAPPLSPDSSSRSALLSMQFPAIQSCKAFFSNSDSDPDPDSDSESENESDTDSFFKGLFENDVGLRVCYEKDHDKGEFYCLVCESQKEGKKGKGVRYKGCIALTQHASTVLKAGLTRPHRAFARAICGVLGWDETRLPSIVLLPGSVLKVNETKENAKETNSNPNPNSPPKELPKETVSNPNPNPPTKELPKETDSNPNPNLPLKELPKETNSNPNPNSSNTEWPSCPTPFPNPNPPVTWAATLAAAPPPPGTTAQSEALARASHIQRKAVKSTRRFLSLLEEEYSGSDSDSDLQPGSDSEVKVKVNSPDVDFDFDFDFEEEGEERPDMEEFFSGIFEKDPRLREYYEKNKEKGDFYCFVCQVRKDFKRKGMRYKSGLALTQHANTVSKEGGRGAHRALARVLCRVFGWDPLSLPGSVKEFGEESGKDEKVGEKSDGKSNDNVELISSALEEKDGRSISS